MSTTPADFRQLLTSLVLAFLLFGIAFPAVAQQIMSFEEYQQLRHVEPYVYHITADSGRLYYFGSRHSYDPDDPQMDSLAAVFRNFRPELVYTEGFPELMDSLTRRQAIRQYGEFGMTWKLTSEDGVPIHSIEPERSLEVNFLRKQGWEDPQIMLFYTLRQISQSRQQGNQIDLETVLPRYLASLAERFGLKGPRTLDEFEAAVRRYLPDVENWRNISPRFFYPGPQDPSHFTNRISTDANLFRDRHHVQVLVEAVQKGRRVLAVVGSAHAVMQQPALQKLLDP